MYYFLHLWAIISRTFFSYDGAGSRRDCDNFQSSGRTEGTRLDGSMTSNGWKGMLRMHVLICSPSRSEGLRTEYSFLSRVSRGVSASKGEGEFLLLDISIYVCVFLFFFLVYFCKWRVMEYHMKCFVNAVSLDLEDC